VSEMMFVGIRLGRRARTHREASADLYALERAHPRGQRAIEQIRLPEAKSVLDPIAGFDSGRRIIRTDFFALEFSLVGSRHLCALVLIPLDSLDCAAGVRFSSTGAHQSMPSIEPVRQAHRGHRHARNLTHLGEQGWTFFAASYSLFTSSA